MVVSKAANRLPQPEHGELEERFTKILVSRPQQRTNLLTLHSTLPWAWSRYYEASDVDVVVDVVIDVVVVVDVVVAS